MSVVAQPEPFVDAARAAAFLCCSRKHVLRLARLNLVPAHPFGCGTERQNWLFLLSELREHVLNTNKMRPIFRSNGRRIPPGGSRNGGQ